MKESALQKKVLALHGTDDWVEGLGLEFKSCKGGFTKEFGPTYSAFANTQGGIVILGVDDKGMVTGVPDPAKQLNELAIFLNNPEKCSRNLLSGPCRIEEMSLDGKKIIAIQVPRCENEYRPIYLSGHVERCYFRQHESDVLCPADMMEQMIRDRVSTTQDNRIVPHSGWADIDEVSFVQFRNRMSSAKPDHKWLALENEALLKKLGGYRSDRITGEAGLTLAGLLMFGTADALTELCPNLQLNYYELDEEDNSSTRWANRLTIDGEWESNLFQFFFKTLRYLTEGIKTPFRLNDDLSRTGFGPAQVAIREALVNALVHADYQGQGGIILRKTRKGIELSNPGTLLLEKEQLFHGGLSICRNGTIQKMFQFMGMAEKAGSGVDKIYEGWVEQFHTRPLIAESHAPARVTWTLPFHGPSVRRDAPVFRADEEPAKLNAILKRKLAAYKEAGRNKPEVTDALVLELCKGRWFSLAQLAGMLGRNPTALRNNTISPLLRHGQLVLKYPDRPNH